MAPRLPGAVVRAQVRVPLRFPDGYATAALVTSFGGLVDGRERLALAPGSPAGVPLVLYDKLAAYAVQDTGLDTYEANLALGHAADERDYAPAAQMLRALGVGALALLSNNPDKAAQLTRLGLTVAARIPTGAHVSAANVRYLSAKARRGHDGLHRAALIAGGLAEVPVEGA